MVTNYQIASHGRTAAAEAHPADGMVVRILKWLRHLFCGLQGHDRLLQFEQHRMFLKCMSCGHESPGWQLAEAPPHVTARIEAPRAARVRPHLITARRIA